MRFGQLTILSFAPDKIYSSGQRHKMAICRCTCGTQKTIQMSSLKSGKTKSCGCLHKKIFRKIITKHGFRSHPLYSILRNMKARCNYPKNINYKNYGGRGIKVCSKWSGSNGIENFIEWNESLPEGKRYKKGLTIDRYPDKDGDYKPSNCRWVSNKENCNNKRNNRFIKYKNKSYTKQQFYEKYNNDVNYRTFCFRLDAGWEPLLAATKQSQKKR